jgi:hypothetical protein
MVMEQFLLHPSYRGRQCYVGRRCCYYRTLSLRLCNENLTTVSIVGDDEWKGLGLYRLEITYHTLCFDLQMENDAVKHCSRYLENAKDPGQGWFWSEQNAPEVSISVNI